MSTIDKTIFHGVTIAAAGSYASPLTITAAGYVDNIGTGVAIYGPNSQAWTVANYGRVVTGGTAIGIDLRGGGLVANSGTISGPGGGVSITGAAGTVVNNRLIQSSLQSSRGVYFNAGGAVTNAANGQIIGQDFGIYITHQQGTIANSNRGQIYGGTGVGIELIGGSVSNAGLGRILGKFSGIIFSAQPGTVTNYWYIGGGVNDGVLDFSGFVTNTPGALIAGGHNGINFVNSGTVNNGGAIHARGSAGAGIYMQAGGVVANASGGRIDVQNVYTPSAIGIHIQGGVGAVTNAGAIHGGSGILLGAGGTVVNSGTITATATTGFAVKVLGGGTVIDSGVIFGGGGTAVYFGGVAANRLVLDPGYNLAGKAIGSTAGGASNTLELAASASIGTLSGIGGAYFANFGAVTVDASANWELTGGNTVGAGVTLTVAGTLTDAGIVTVAGAFDDLGSVVVAAAGTLAGALTVEGGGSAEFQGAVSNGATIAFGGGVGTLIVDDLASAPGGVQTQDFNAGIAGLIGGDKIRIATSGLGNFTGIDSATPGAFNGATTPLVLTSGGAMVATLTLDGNYAGDAFAVSQPAGGLVTVALGMPAPVNLYDFFFLYNDYQAKGTSAGDYYYGTVADDGSFGYSVGESIAAPLGTYIIYANAGLTGQPAGTVNDYFYWDGAGSHLAFAPFYSTLQGHSPVENGGGLGSDFDYLLDDSGRFHFFDAAAEAIVHTSTVFDFYFTFNDFAANGANGGDYYYGTVADDGRFGYAIGATIATALGSYHIYGTGGVTAQMAGTVDDYFYWDGASSHQAYSPYYAALQGHSPIDSPGGLGNDFDYILAGNGQFHPFGGNLAEAKA